jgi:hypothetical protein
MSVGVQDALCRPMSMGRPENLSPLDRWLVVGFGSCWRRFAGCTVRKLGHEAIECRVLDGMDADQALLAEIDENLVRADLTPSERAAHHAKRKQLYLKLHPETEKGKAGGRPRKTSDKMSKVLTRGYAKAAAKNVGKTSRTVARDVSRGEKIDHQGVRFKVMRRFANR